MIEDARAYCQVFFRWYNTVYRHNGIGLMRRTQCITATTLNLPGLRGSSAALQRARAQTTHGANCRLDQPTQTGNHRPGNHHSQFIKLFTPSVAKVIDTFRYAAQ